MRILQKGLSRLIPVIILAVLLGYPLISLFIQIFFPQINAYHPSWAPSLSVVKEAWSNPLFRIASSHSLLLAFTVATASTLLGTVLAIAWQWHNPYGRRIFTTLMWVLFLTPSFVIAEGWELWGMPGGIGSHGLGLGSQGLAVLFSPWGIWWVLTLRFFSLPMMAVGATIENMGREYLDAAQILGAGYFFRQWRILLPLLLPSILSSFFLTFAETIGDFGVAATLGSSSHYLLLSYLIFQSLTTFPANFGLVGAYGLSLIVMVVIVQGSDRIWLRRASHTVVHGNVHRRPPERTSLWATIALAIPFVLGLGVPLITYVWVSLLPSLSPAVNIWHLSLVNFSHALSGHTIYQAVWRSLGYAVIAAIITVVIGLYLGALSGKEVSRLTAKLLTATIAIPGLILGISYVFAYNAPWLVNNGFNIYGTPIALEMAYIAGSLPFVVRMLAGARSQMDHGLDNAGAVLGAGLLRRLRTLVIPLLWPTIVSSTLLVLTNVMFELPASELLYPSGSPTLAVAIIHLFNNFHYGQGAALTISGILLVSLVTLLVRILQSRLFSGWKGSQKSVASPETSARTLPATQVEEV